ncbi:MAG: nitrous oxide-stimulated promoter family protein [Promethearchaeota archaeon]
MSNRPRNDGPRIRDEKQTVENMINYYCEKKHSSNEGLCADCTQLLEYSHQRLERCSFGEGKPTCRKCTVHCYKPDMRNEIRSVMRYSGPRLVLKAPISWIRHKIHDRK